MNIMMSNAGNTIMFMSVIMIRECTGSRDAINLKLLEHTQKQNKRIMTLAAVIHNTLVITHLQSEY